MIRRCLYSHTFALLAVLNTIQCMHDKSMLGRVLADEEKKKKENPQDRHVRFRRAKSRRTKISFIHGSTSTHVFMSYEACIVRKMQGRKRDETFLL